MSVFSSSLRSRIFFLDDFAGALAGFFEKITQRDVLAGARLHEFPVFAENAAKRDVAQIRRVTFASRDLENLFEMQNLRRADHVPNCVRFQIVDPIIDCGDIGGGVIEAAVPFSNDQRFIGQFGIVAKENDYRAFADFGDTGFEQAFDHTGRPIVVKTFAALNVVMNIEQFVNMLEILH